MLLSTCMRAGLSACLIALTLTIAPASAEPMAAKPGAGRALAAIVSRALEENPSVQAARAAADAAEARLSGAAQPLHNPELELGVERTDVDTYTIGISQTIDWHDKRNALEQVARTEWEIARSQLAALRFEKSIELLQALGRISTLREITTLSKRRSGILKRFARLAEQRHTAGDIPQTERELARLSLAEAVMQHTANQADLIQARSDFFSLSGTVPSEAISLPVPLITDTPDVSDEEALLRNHPLLRTVRLMTQAARQQIHAADLGRKADPTFGISAGHEDEEGLIGLSFSIPLQIRNDFRSDVDSMRAQAVQSEQEAHQTYRNLRAQLRSARERHRLVADAWSLWTSQGRISLQQRVDLLETLWQAGEMSTTDYLLQVQQTLDTQIAGVRLRGDLWSAWVEWLNASGTLNAWLNEISQEQ